MITRQEVADAIVSQFDKWIADRQREDQGFNRSVLIDSINRWVSVPLGSPYCIASDLYAAFLACNNNKWTFPIPRCAGTQSFWFTVAPAHYKRPHQDLIKKGDVVIFQDIANHAHGHGVLVRCDEVAGSPLFMTDEGNTDGSGGREGDGFYNKTRSINGDSSKHFLGAIDICQWIVDANH